MEIVDGFNDSGACGPSIAMPESEAGTPSVYLQPTVERVQAQR
jgi:hypothetical protein